MMFGSVWSSFSTISTILSPSTARVAAMPASSDTHVALLPRSATFIVALAAISATAASPPGADWETVDEWLTSLLSLLDLEREILPETVLPQDVRLAVEREIWDNEMQHRIVKCLLQAALMRVSYSPVSRAAAHGTLSLLGLDTALLPRVEAELGTSLAVALDGVQESKRGWIWSLAGAGLVGLSVSGLTTPPPPTGLGTLFGMAGGLEGWRVRGTQFGFVPVGGGTSLSEEEVDELRSDTHPEDREAMEEVQQVRAQLAPGSEKRPTLTATIVVPGLLTASRCEALATWRSICSATNRTLSLAAPPPCDMPSGLQDGRDVYILRCESSAMLDTGRSIKEWSGKLDAEDGAIDAYHMAMALPQSAYKSSTVDNSWTNALGIAVKAGKLLGEVLARRVQGERPVILVGTSTGALTVLSALLHLATLDIPPVVESVFLISLPTSPSHDEWGSVRRVVARRVVNAWCGNDFALVAVVCLRQVCSGVSSGVVAGLGPVRQSGVEDVDLSEVVESQLQINGRIPQILQLLDMDD